MKRKFIGCAFGKEAQKALKRMAEDDNLKLVKGKRYWYTYEKKRR